MRAVFTERLGLKVTALLIALLLWFIVGAERRANSREERQRNEGPSADRPAPVTP